MNESRETSAAVLSQCTDGDRFLRKGQHEQAELAYTVALKADPGCVRAWIGLGDSRRHRGLHGDALIAYQRALALDARSGTAMRGAADACRGLHRYAESIQYWRQYLSRIAFDWRAWSRLGDLLLRTRQIDEAEKAYRRSTDIDKRSRHGWLGLAKIAAQRNDTATAAKMRVLADAAANVRQIVTVPIATKQSKPKE